MIQLNILLLIFGTIFHRNNYLLIAMILELIYLLIAYLLLSFQLDYLVIVLLGITGSESAIGLTLLLNYYIRAEL